MGWELSCGGCVPKVALFRLHSVQLRLTAEASACVCVCYTPDGTATVNRSAYVMHAPPPVRVGEQRDNPTAAPVPRILVGTHHHGLPLVQRWHQPARAIRHDTPHKALGIDIRGCAPDHLPLLGRGHTFQVGGMLQVVHGGLVLQNILAASEGGWRCPGKRAGDAYTVRI